MRMSPMAASGLILPPVLVGFFLWAWRRLGAVIAPQIFARAPFYGAGYVVLVHLILVITLLFLRLYFLPRNQSVLAPETAAERALGELAREPDGPVSSSTLLSLGLDERVLAKLATERVRVLGKFADAGDDDLLGGSVREQAVLVLPEWCGRCSRTRPQRTRHCRECGTCRMGFDHHCAFFGNCLTAPYLPLFLALLLLTPLVVLGVCFPLYWPLYARAKAAYKLAPAWWWDKWWSWVCGGPFGRYLIATALGWRDLDKMDPKPELSLEIGTIVFLGNILGLMTLALGYTTATALRRGQFTVDLARAKSYARDPERFGQVTRFYVPVTPRRSPSVTSPLPSPLGPPLGPSLSPVSSSSPRSSDVSTNGTYFAAHAPSSPNGSPYEPIATYGDRTVGVLVTITEQNIHDTPETRPWIFRGKSRPWRILHSEFTGRELEYWPIRRDVLRDVQRQKDRWLMT